MKKNEDLGSQVEVSSNQNWVRTPPPPRWGGKPARRPGSQVSTDDKTKLAEQGPEKKEQKND